MAKLVCQSIHSIVVKVRVIILTPWYMALAMAELAVQIIKADARHLGYPDNLAHQVTPVLNMLDLLAQEAGLNSID